MHYSRLGHPRQLLHALLYLLRPCSRASLYLVQSLTTSMSSVTLVHPCTSSVGSYLLHLGRCSRRGTRQLLLHCSTFAHPCARNFPLPCGSPAVVHCSTFPHPCRSPVDRPFGKGVIKYRKDAEAWIRKRVKEKYGIENLKFS